MRTAQEWMIRRHDNNLPMRELIEQIQLDAYKAGMTRAAEKCYEIANRDLSQEAHNAGESILTERDNLKELPK